MSTEPRMSVRELLGGNFLRRGDVILCANKKGGFSGLIRFGTRSPFSHAASIFVVPKRDLGFNNTFVIESAGKGVDIRDLRHYVVDHADEYKVAVKRLERSWFQEGDEGRRLRELMRGHMLDFIRAEYDFLTVWRLAKQIARRMLFGIALVRRKSFKGLIANHRVPNKFICSGFVQYAFYATVCRVLLGDGGEEVPRRAGAATDGAARVHLSRDDDLAAQRRLIEAAREARLGRTGRAAAGAGSGRQAMAARIAAGDLSRLEEVDFAGAGEDEDPLSALLATTPEELAVTEKLAWKYLITSDQVHEVASYPEAKAVMGIG